MFEAYCKELKRIMSIEEAQEAYFAQTEPRKRFTFLCSDEACRNLIIPTPVTAAYYSHEHPAKTPHFKRNPAYSHAETCYWGEYYTVQTEALQDRERYKDVSDKNFFLDLENIEPHEAYDEFYIPIPREKRQAEAPVNRRLTHNEIRNHVINIHNKTSSLVNVVDTFRKLTDDQKDTFLLTLLDSPRHIYNKAFKPVYAAKEGFFWNHIYYGIAKVYKYSNPEKGYRIFFQNNVCLYRKKDNNQYSVVAKFIPESSFTHSYKCKMLKNELEKYAKSKEQFCCYILANETHLDTIDLAGGKSIDAVVIEQASSHGIVLKEISPNCK